MSQILLIEADDTLRKIIKLNLMKSIGCDVIEKQTAKDAISLLQILPDIDLVISREIIGTENTGLTIANYLEKEASAIPLLIIGNKISTYNHVIAVEANQSWKNITNVACKVLGVVIDPDVNRIVADYVPVGIHYFLNITSTSSIGCDVYIRVKKNEKEFQFVKRLHSKDMFSRADILKYKESGLKEFYISKEHFTKFVNFVTAELVAQLGRAKLEGVDRALLSSEAYEVTLDRIHSLGIDDLTIELVKESIYSMESSLQEKNNLAIFLKTLKANPLSCAYAHSYLCCLILHKVVAHFDWESVQVKEKLTYAAYFHDISLKDISFMEINAIKELENSKLSEEDKKIVNNHALLSSAIVERFPNIPAGVITIIKEHHGSKSGIGFPEILSISITPISMMFIVVEHFVDEFLKIKGTPSSDDLKKIFLMLGKRYNKVTYQQTFVALQNMTQHKKKQVS